MLHKGFWKATFEDLEPEHLVFNCTRANEAVHNHLSTDRKLQGTRWPSLLLSTIVTTHPSINHGPMGGPWSIQPPASVLCDELYQLLEHLLMDSKLGPPISLGWRRWRWVQCHQPACLNLGEADKSIQAKFSERAVAMLAASQAPNTKRNIWNLLAETSAISSLDPVAAEERHCKRASWCLLQGHGVTTE